MAAIPLSLDVEYPESDGRPLGESDLHRDEIVDLIAALRHRYQETADVYVAGNLFLYYQKGDPRAVVCPDVFLVRGVEKRKRRTYRLWEEGRVPSLVVEVTSLSTSEEDLWGKKSTYERLGVEEYFLFDPEGEYLTPRFQGFRLVKGRYVPLSPGADGSLPSRVTGLALRPEEDKLRLVDPGTGERLLWIDELADARDAAEARARDAEARAAHAEEELARLRREAPNAAAPEGQGVRLRAFAPAGVGNFAAGFDVLGAAVAPVDGSLWGDWVEVEESDAPRLVCTGPFAHLLPPDPADNLVSLTRDLFAERVPLPPLSLTLYKGLPVGSGLASSATSVAATAVALNAWCGSPLGPAELLALAGKAESHASGAFHLDNVAPALLGGLLLVPPSGLPRSLPLPPDLRIVMASPALELATREARRVLPREVPLALAVDHAQNLAGLVHALSHRRPGALAGDPEGSARRALAR